MKLDRAIVQVAMLFPDNVGMDDHGRFLPNTLPTSILRGLVPAAPLKPGRKPSIARAELSAEWDRARATLMRDLRRVTMATMAEQLSAQVGYYVSPETVKRYRKRDSLSL